MADKQVVSKQRVIDRGEVFTSPREVNAMLDLVKQETERIDARFLEPACGTGNFLVEILRRKLCVVADLYARSHMEYERYAVLAVSSIYGIDILQENVVACRKRLLSVFDEAYSSVYKARRRDRCRPVVRYILGCNIIWGDALSLKTPGEDPRPIVFAEWAPVGRNMIKRRDYSFRELLASDLGEAPTLFDVPAEHHLSDRGEPVFIPTPVKEYPPMHFLRVADVETR